jgi:hypothetical protein
MGVVAGHWTVVGCCRTKNSWRLQDVVDWLSDLPSAPRARTLPKCGDELQPLGAILNIDFLFLAQIPRPQHEVDCLAAWQATSFRFIGRNGFPS